MGYPFQRRFLERGIMIRMHESSSFVSNHLKLFNSIIGLIIDENLTYQVHVGELFNNLSKRLGVLRHISPYLKVLEEKSGNHLL